ncbi:SDR family oxidoreductase [Streptomyces sp. NPDC004539]|uniref:SDR family oxidoreductase n=1 Tax=Streptomyces sp. NPDC004539 TaxID=3154280 RepID=UPI0033AB11B4
MRVFVTGASGWIGSALVPELLGAGHEVTGLARSDSSADALKAAGAEVVRGSLDDLDVLRDAAAGSDGVVHLAFAHDVAFGGGFDRAAGMDRLTIDAFGDALAGSDRPFVLASGLMLIAPGRVATESDLAADGPATGPHVRHHNAVATVALAERGVRSSVLRLPPTVHGDGDAGFMATLVDIARARGAAGYVGDGTVRWPAGHRSDVARLFRLALEQAPAGSVLHGNAETGVELREVAEAIGRGLGVPAVSVPAEEAEAHFGWLASFFGLDSPASSAHTQELLGWTPEGPGLIADLDAGHYFTEGRTGAFFQG